MAPYDHYRKLLLESVLKLDDNYESCYMCYVCPDYCTKYRARRPPPSPPHQRHQMPSVLIIMLCVLGASFLFMSYLIARYRSRNSRSPTREDSHENGGRVLPAGNPTWFIQTPGYWQSTIDSIGVVKFKMEEGSTAGIQETECPICLSEFEEDESLRLLPKCSHAFHVPCIDTWLRSHLNCPVCRAVPNLPVAVNDDGAAGDGNVMEPSDSVNSDRRDETESENTDRDQTMTTGSIAIDEVITDPIEEDVDKSESFCQIDLICESSDRDLRTVRRSVSMDFCHHHHAALTKVQCSKLQEEGCSGMKQDSQIKMNTRKGSRNSSIHRSVKGSSSARSIKMKRSLSFGGKNSGQEFVVACKLFDGMRSPA